MELPVTQFILTLSCRNRPGIVAAVATAIFEHGGNIREAQQFDDTESGQFFARIVLDHPENSLDVDRLDQALGVVAARFAMTWVLRDRRGAAKGDVAGLQVRSLPDRHPVSLAHR